MSTVSRRSIESLWYEPGTAADAAACVNKYSAEKHNGDSIRRIWSRAQDEGRLPDLDRGQEMRAGRMPVLKLLWAIVARKRVQA